MSNLLRPPWTVPACLSALAALAALAAARPAWADDPKPPVEVTITPRGQSWSVGGHGGQECDPTCRMHLPPDKYEVIVGGAKEEILVDGPTAITYSPGYPRLRTAAGWVAVGGVGAGGLIMGIGVYAYVKSCSASSGCPHLPSISRTAAQVLVTTAGALITISVAGAIMYAVTGESLRARDLPAPAAALVPDPRRRYDVRVTPSGLGATLEFVKRF